jgi:hypothetical protein
VSRPNREETLREARANGVPPLTAVDVVYDGMTWFKFGGPKRREVQRKCAHGAWLFVAICRGPGCWRFTAKKAGVAVGAPALVGSLNAAKLRAAMLVRAERRP